MQETKAPTIAKKVKRPDTWPRWPILCLKRYNNDGDLEFGAIVEDQADVKPIVYRVPVFMTHEAAISRPDREAIVFSNWDEVMAAGWVVD